MNRTHGEVNYYLIQFLSGHGCFKAYFHGIGKERRDEGRYCGHSPDNADTPFCDAEDGTRKDRRYLQRLG